MIQKISMEVPTHEDAGRTSKLAILGLGNAGKTSIIKTILYEFRAFAHILPTTGVDRTNFEFFGKKLVVWDFGGQEQYREIYLTRPIMYFQGISYLYYVVDAQDMENLQKSIDYFRKILETAHEYSDEMKVYLFFHKVDPECIGKIDFSVLENLFIEAVVDDFTKFHINPVVFHTSIFNPISVISGFSQPLLGNKTIYETLCDVVDSFCWERDLPFGMIFVNNFEIGRYFASKAVYKYVGSRVTAFLEWLDEIDDTSEYELGDYDIITKEFEIEVGDKTFNFYFSVGIDQMFDTDDIKDVFEDMDEFTSDLEKILQNSEIIRSGQLLTGEIYSDEMLEARRLQQQLEEELINLEEEDKAAELSRMRELDVLGDQYQNMIDSSLKEVEYKKNENEDSENEDEIVDDDEDDEEEYI